MDRRETMSEYKKQISREEYLQALGLFTLANGRYVESVTFARALNRIIMITPEKYPGGHVDDLIYSGDQAGPDAFDEALRREGIAVEKPKAKRRR
jgi:hypothetical protein